MSSGEIERVEPKGEDTEASSTEVEFALVLSRIIASVNSDPEQLRGTIYELARYKLQEKLEATGSAEQQRKSLDALENAIQGVEAFSRKKQVISPLPQQLMLGSPAFERPSPELISRLERSTPRFTHEVLAGPSTVRRGRQWTGIVR
jgi:hypothetical protein